MQSGEEETIDKSTSQCINGAKVISLKLFQRAIVVTVVTCLLNMKKAGMTVSKSTRGAALLRHQLEDHPKYPNRAASSVGTP
ncbi:hypothetical protein TNCV_1171491 [Trichonephila clavipes]|nr:hypothetical protein TNCV_1171491 [Trichonephila clavipes]